MGLTWKSFVVTCALGLIGSLVLLGISTMGRRRLPDGRLRSLALVTPECVGFMRRLIAHPSVPWRARLVLGCGIGYALSPVTLIPDFIPVLGKVDNVLALVIASRLSIRMIPAPVLSEAWHGDHRTFQLLTGRQLAQGRETPEKAQRSVSDAGICASRLESSRLSGHLRIGDG
jgi:uncharacterized membrane protein YkvA (DUF1232 family)